MLVSLHMHTLSHVCIAKSKVKTDTSFRENWEGHGKKSNKLVCVYHCSITMNWKYCLIIEWLEWKWEQQLQWRESSGEWTWQTRRCCSYATSPNKIESNGKKVVIEMAKQATNSSSLCADCAHCTRYTNINKYYFEIISFNVHQRYEKMEIQLHDAKQAKCEWANENEIAAKRYKMKKIDSVYQ